jgi:hypothetical protein
MANRHDRVCWIAAAAAALALTALAPAADAAVVCQKGAKVKLRAGDCKPQETRLATLGGSGADPAGIWEFTGGNLYEDYSLEAEYLVLDPDGSGRVNLSGGDGPVLSCGTLRYSVGAGQSLVVDDFGFLLGTRVFGYELEGDSTLKLVDAVGRTASFERASAVDPEKECGKLVEQKLFKALPDPNQPSGLVFDGNDLYYNEDGGSYLVPIDPVTGAPGTRLPFDGGNVHAAAPVGDFWTHCACGGNGEAMRVTRNGQTVDTIQTWIELGEGIGIEAIASEPATGVVWLFGWTEDDQGRLLKVDASGEPDVLLEAFDLDASITGMSFGGNALWALDWNGPSVLRIDPATGAVNATFLLPDRYASWRSIAAVGRTLFVAGEHLDDGALLMLDMP